MERLGERPSSGIFEIGPDRWIHGELSVAGEKSSLYLRDASFFMIDGDETTLRGVLHDLTKVTLVKCGRAGPGSASRNGEGYSFATTFPHYVVQGDAHLDPNTPSIASVEFRISDEAHLFRDFGAFGSLIDAKPFIGPIVEAFGDIVHQKIEIGDAPEIAFFSGKTKIFETDSAVGNILVRHHVGAGFGGASGVRIANQVWCSVSYENGALFEDITIHIMTLLRFFELVIGRTQSLVDCDLVLKSAN